ncbi:transposase family protein [Streptomyces sp. NPDC004362]|uniref:transposase family protein n=1 Tax=Streptomyces sp. NPDC004362 TaxID=3154456 RepID=UPI0033A5A842
MRRRVPGAGAGQGGDGGRREHVSTHAHAIPHNPAQTTPTPPTPTPTPTPTPSNSNKAAGPGALADLGFLGLDKDCHDQVVVTGYKATRARNLTTGQNTANRIIAAGCAPVERGFAHLKTWRILTKLRTSPARAAAPAKTKMVDLQ